MGEAGQGTRRNRTMACSRRGTRKSRLQKSKLCWLLKAAYNLISSAHRNRMQKI
ncbi:hypothetical protein YC2023_005478 [Brassica napus]